MTKLTLKAAQKELAIVGMTLRKVEGEYQVYPKGQPDKAYFTDDIADAWRTGLVMAVNSSPVFLSDTTPVKTLGQLNAMLKPEAQGWTVRRSPAGYYYMTHDTHAPSAGIYVHHCAGTLLGFWRRELAQVIKDSL